MSVLESRGGELATPLRPVEVSGQLSLEFPGWVEQAEEQVSPLDISIDEITRRALEHHRLINGRDDERDLERVKWAHFFRDGFREAHQTPYEGRVVRGPLYADINQALGVLSEEVAKIHPELTPECFFPGTYRPREASAIVRKIYQYKGGDCYDRDFRNFRSKRESAISQALAPKADEILKQTIPSGVLNRPDYRRMPTERSCATTSFLMVMDAITGQHADDKDLHRVISWEYFEDTIHDEEYLKLLQSDRFQEAFGKTVQVASFVGADFAIIGKTAERLKQGNPDRRVFSVVNLLSDTSFLTRVNGIWHSAILLGVNDRDVVIHEPSTDGWGEEIHIPKAEFLHRWGQGLFRTHLVIAE